MSITRCIRYALSNKGLWLATENAPPTNYGFVASILSHGDARICYICVNIANYLLPRVLYHSRLHFAQSDKLWSISQLVGHTGGDGWIHTYHHGFSSSSCCWMILNALEKSKKAICPKMTSVWCVTRPASPAPLARVMLGQPVYRQKGLSSLALAPGRTSSSAEVFCPVSGSGWRGFFSGWRTAGEHTSLGPSCWCHLERGALTGWSLSSCLFTWLVFSHAGVAAINWWGLRVWGGRWDGSWGDNCSL